MISKLNSYVILVPGSDVTPKVEAVIKELYSGADYVTRWDDGRAQIDCPNERFQRRWMRRLKSACRKR